VCEEVPDPSTASPSRVAVYETAVKLGTDQQWLYVAFDVETKLLLGMFVSERRGMDPAVDFLNQAEKHDLSETTLHIDGMGYLDCSRPV
jgi:transposase-like protein